MFELDVPLHVVDFNKVVSVKYTAFLIFRSPKAHSINQLRSRFCIATGREPPRAFIVSLETRPKSWLRRKWITSSALKLKLSMSYEEAYGDTANKQSSTDR